MASSIRILLVDDHPALRMGLRIVLEQAPGVRVVAEAGSGQEALALIQALRPDVAVLELGRTSANRARETGVFHSDRP
jgi:DNA-binding NarL/FixJ family response regulator